MLVIGGYWTLISYRSGIVDWVVLVVAVALGVLGIWLAPWRRGNQRIATVVYVPAMSLVLFFSLLFLECSTGNWL